MLNMIYSVGRAVTACAVIIPGIDGLAEFIGHSAGLNVTTNGTLVEAGGNVTEGMSRTIADIAIAAQKFILHAAHLSAEVGNAIGVDHLAGVGENGLTARSFTENGGIIVKVLQNFFQYLHLLPEVAGQAAQEGNRGVVAAGALLGVGAIAAVPSLGTELHNAAAVGVSKAGQAVQHAQTEVGKFAQIAGSSIGAKNVARSNSVATA